MTITLDNKTFLLQDHGNNKWRVGAPPSNSSPTDIALSSSSIAANAGANGAVGTLSTVDADVGDTHTYTLVAGAGDTDNASFSISGSALRCNDPATLGVGSYSVRIQSDDGASTPYQESFAVTVTAATSGWNFVRDFNSGTLGQSASSQPDGFYAAAGSSFYTTDQVAEGSQACELNITAGATGFGQWGGEVRHDSELAEGDDYWFHVKQYVPASFDFTTNFHLKFLRCHVKQAGGANRGYVDIYVSADGTFYYQNEVTDQNEHLPNIYTVARDTWETYVYHVNLASSGGGRVRLWQNGNLILDNTTFNTLGASSDLSDFLYLYTYWNGGSPATQKLYVDDIRVSSDTVPSWAPAGA